MHVGIGGGEIGLGGAYIWTLEQELGGQSRRYGRNSQSEQAAAAHRQIGRRAGNQHSQRGDILPQREVERRDIGAYGRDQALLLGDIELGRGAGREPLLDQRENSVGGGEIAVRDAQAVLGFEDQEIGGGNAHNRGEDNDLLVEALGDCALLGRERGRGVLTPEIDLVAGVEDRAVKLALGWPSGTGPSRSRRLRGA